MVFPFSSSQNQWKNEQKDKKVNGFNGQTNTEMNEFNGQTNKEMNGFKQTDGLTAGMKSRIESTRESEEQEKRKRKV